MGMTGFASFASRELDVFLKASLNVFIFLPHFFSFNQLLRTLFSPWKNLTTKKETKGFSMDEFIERISFNIVSRLVGSMARSSIIMAYCTTVIMLVLGYPLMLVVFILILPLRYLLSLISPSQEEKKASIKAQFIKTHTIDNVNTPQIESWFDQYWETVHKIPWWTKRRLMAIPPLARDWTSGYTPMLEKFCIDLTKSSNTTNIIQRSEELEHIMRTLSKSRGANIILVGDEGVGRATIINNFASLIWEGKTTPHLMYKRVLQIDINGVLSLSTDYIKRTEILKSIFVEADRAGNIILVVFNIDSYVVTNKDRIDISKVLEEFAESYRIHIIATTTPHAFQKYLYSKDSLREHFDVYDIREINPSQATEILLSIALTLEIRYKVAIPYKTVLHTVNQSVAYISGTPLPEKAITLLDEACNYTSMQLKKNIVLPEIVDTVLGEKTHIPTALTDTLKNKLLYLEKTLSQRIIHQDQAVHVLSQTLKKAFILTSKTHKPLASFLFLGPTGVGKTETAKALRDAFFQEDKAMLRFDMSNYQTKLEIPKLIGDQVRGEPGIMTQAIRQQRYGILLLDEIEKADKDLLNIFLTILDEGYYTDGYGKKVDCSHLIIIATSNAGAEYLSAKVRNQGPLIDTQALSSELIDHLIDSKLFLPEFLNRFDGVVVYQPLNPTALLDIAKIKIASVIYTVQQKHGITVEVSNNYIEGLIQKGYDPRFGARNLERTIQDELESNIATKILDGSLKEGDVVNF